MEKRGAKNATALRSVQVKRTTSNRDASAHRSVKGSAAQKANLASDSRMVSSKKLEKKTAKTEEAEKGKAQKSNTKRHTLKMFGERSVIRSALLAQNRLMFSAGAISSMFEKSPPSRSIC
jgi:hypothetical protein